LGIGDELSRLETEFTDEDKETLSLKARAELFPLVSETLAAVTTKFRSLADRLRPLESQLKTLEDEQPPRLNERVVEPFVSRSSVLISELEADLQHEADELTDSAQTKLAFAFSSTLESYDNAIKVAEKKRLSTYAATAAVCILIGFGFTFGYAYLKRTAGQSVGEVVLWGVVASLLANAIGLGITWFRDNYPERKRKIIEQYLVTLVDQADRTINDVLGNHKFMCLEETVVTAKVRRIYSDVVDLVAVDHWQLEIDRQWETVRTVRRELSHLRAEYLSIIDEIVQGFGRFFNDSEKNLSVLQKISDEVKDRAIQPSFQLLASTSQQLVEIKQEIQAIEFA